MAPKDVHILIPMYFWYLPLLPYVTLYGRRDFADVFKDLEMKGLSWIIWVGPQCMGLKREIGDLRSSIRCDNGSKRLE